MTTKKPRAKKMKDPTGAAAAMQTKMPQELPDVQELQRLVREHCLITRKALAVQGMYADRRVLKGPRKGEVIKSALPQTAIDKLKMLYEGVPPEFDAAGKPKPGTGVMGLADEATILEPKIMEIVKRQPIYQHFMKHTPGLASGGIICGYLIGFIDIKHGGKDGSERKDKTLREWRDPVATKLSHIVRYCGYAGGTDAHGHQTGRMERPQAGVKLGYNAELRTRLYQWASVLIKGGSTWAADTKYYKLYADTKHRLTTDPRYDEKANTFEGRKTDRGEDAKGARAYMHSKAWHKMVHLLLEDLYVVWRTIEGLPVWPSYYSAKMGYGHGGMPTASKYGPGLGPKQLTLPEALEMVGIKQMVVSEG